MSIPAFVSSPSWFSVVVRGENLRVLSLLVYPLYVFPWERSIMASERAEGSYQQRPFRRLAMDRGASMSDGVVQRGLVPRARKMSRRGRCSDPRGFRSGGRTRGHVAGQNIPGMIRETRRSSFRRTNHRTEGRLEYKYSPRVVVHRDRHGMISRYYPSLPATPRPRWHSCFMLRCQPYYTAQYM